MLFNDYKSVVYVGILIGAHQIFAVEVLDNVENKTVNDSKSNVTKREEISGRARKSSFVFKDDYNDYADYSNTGYGSDDYSQDNYSGQLSQGVRGGRLYQPNYSNNDKKVKFPVDDARESLSSLIDDANHNYGVYSSNYNNAQATSDNHRVKGGRGLFPFDSNSIDQQNQYGSQYNNYESESVRGQQQQLNSYGQPAISSSQPYKFVDPYSHKNYENEDPSQQKLQTQEYVERLQQQQQYLLAQKQQQEALRQQQLQQQQIQHQLLQQQQQQQSHGYDPQSQIYRPPVGSGASQFPGPYSPEYLQQQYLSSFPGVSHQDLHQRPGIAQAFPGTFGTKPNLHIGAFPPPGNYKLPNGVEISFTPPPGFAGGETGPIIHSQPPHQPHSPPSSYQHLYERPFQSPYAPDRISHHQQAGQHPYGQYANQFANYGQGGNQFPGPVNPALLYPQGPSPHQHQGGLNPHELGVIGGIGAVNGPNGFGNAAFAPQGNRGPFGGLYDALGRQPDGFGRRISRAIEEISKNDDLQCVPKLVCQMVGTRMRDRPLPNFIDVGSLGTLIEAIPVETPSAVYMRAALLGLTNGDRRCYHAYNRCPSNEDDVLYYLNNHRGGFFRFFNGEDNTLNDQQLNHQQQQQQQSDGISGLLGLLTGNAPQGGNPQSQLNLLALQNIAAALGGTTSAVRDPPAQQSGGLNLGALSGLASNFQLLSTLGSLFGGGGSGRSNAKETEIEGRQLDGKEDYSQFKDLDFSKVVKNMIVAYSGNSTDNSGRTKRSAISQTIDTTSGTTNSPPVSSTIQARIVNKAPIYSYIPDTTGQSLTSNNRYIVNNNPSPHQPLPDQTINSIDIDRYPQQSQHNRITPDQIPIKTGTGSLAFSNEHFNNRYTRPNNVHYQQQQQLLLQQQQLLEEMEREQKDRLAEQDRLSQLSQYYTNTHRFQYNSQGSRPASSNYNRYSYDRYRPGTSSNSNYNNNNRYTSHSSSSNYNSGGSGRVYVTNAQGVNEYYLENGRKHYLK